MKLKAFKIAVSCAALLLVSWLMFSTSIIDRRSTFFRPEPSLRQYPYKHASIAPTRPSTHTKETPSSSSTEKELQVTRLSTYTKETPSGSSTEELQVTHPSTYTEETPSSSSIEELQVTRPSTYTKETPSSISTEKELQVTRPNETSISESESAKENDPNDAEELQVTRPNEASVSEPESAKEEDSNHATLASKPTNEKHLANANIAKLLQDPKAAKDLSPDSLEALAEITKQLIDQGLIKGVYKSVGDVQAKPSEPNGRPPLPVQPLFDEHMPEPKDDGSGLDPDQISDYIESITDVRNTHFRIMGCPGQDDPGDRYELLRAAAKKDRGIKYFFALNLTQVVGLLPRLMSTILQVFKYLGPENCALSIVEGRSTDGTYLVLHELRHALRELGVYYRLDQSDIEPHGEGKDRIEELGKLRNMALDPLRDEPEIFSESPITVFINDVALCPDDILELFYQHTLQNATMTCGFDWTEEGDLFYDVWVSRTMTGNTFFEIPQDGSWTFSRNLFWDDPAGKDKYSRFQPFQVFSCWGGMVTLDSRPFMTRDIEFRRNMEGECYGGEPQLLGSDLVKLGISRVLVVPTVNVAYSDTEGQGTKNRLGYVSDKVDVNKRIEVPENDTETERIEWLPPPNHYRCMPGFSDVWWVPSVFIPPEEDEQQQITSETSETGETGETSETGETGETGET